MHYDSLGPSKPITQTASGSVQPFSAQLTTACPYILQWATACFQFFHHYVSVFKLFIFTTVKILLCTEKHVVPICLKCLNCTKFGKLILRKLIKIVATRCHISNLKCTKFDFGWGSAPDPAGGAFSTPLGPIAGLKGSYF